MFMLWIYPVLFGFLFQDITFAIVVAIWSIFCLYITRKSLREFQASSSTTANFPVPHTAITHTSILHVVEEPMYPSPPADVSSITRSISVYEIPFEDITSIKVGNAKIMTISQVDIGLASSERESYIQRGFPNIVHVPILTQTRKNCLSHFTGSNLCIMALKEPYQFKRLVLAKAQERSQLLSSPTKNESRGL
jgi:hypothetical protein